MPTWMPPLLAILAVARLTRLVTVDRMPIGRLRQRLVNRGNLPGKKATMRVLTADARYVDVKAPAWYAELAVCPWCISVLIGAGYVALCWWQPSVMGWVSLGLAASFGAGVASRWSE